MRILLQVPDGLKGKALEIAEAIEREGNEVIISAEPCYGACDLREHEARLLGCEKIVHYGHTKFLESRTPVVYEEIRESLDPVPLLEKEFKKISAYSSFGLVSSLQFVDSLRKAGAFLEGKGKKAVVGKGIHIAKKLYPGQVLGCDFTAAKAVEADVDCFLFFGSGRFHPLGLALSTDRPVFVVDLERQELESLASMKNKFLRQRFAAQALFNDARRVGVLVSAKPGQRRLEVAERVRKQLKEKGKQAFILYMDEIKPDKLEWMGFDAFVSTACPRIAVEHRTGFGKPILNPEEI
jgi:2-(3-amino-3-carboxypropyl)histidine synthase